MEESNDIFEILAEEPQDHAADKRTVAKSDPSDFAEITEETTDNDKTTETGRSDSVENDSSGDSESDNTATDADIPGDPESDNEVDPEKPLTERQKKIQDAKKEVVQSLIEPVTIIAFADMGLSRLGSMVPGSERSDWKLDAEEKDIIASILEATIEEDGIEFWPAHTWLIIAVIFIYGAKGFEVWDGSNASRAEDPETMKLEGEKDIARLEIIRDLEKRKAALKTEISEYQEVKFEDPSSTDKGSNGHAPDDGYVYEADGVTHVTNVDGSWKKRPGTKPAGRVVEDAEIVEENNDNDGEE